MLTLKRRIGRVLRKITKTKIIPEHALFKYPEQRALKKFFKHFEVDCVFDVGANTGQYADFLRNSVGWTGPIVSFEPIPELAAALAARAKVTPNWFIEPIALDRESGPAVFNVMADSQFSSLLTPASGVGFDEENKVSVQIPVTKATLSEVMPRLQAQLGFKRCFLKMDTQGNDLAVFEGAQTVIDMIVGLQSELSVHAVYEGVDDFGKALSVYIANGWHLTSIFPSNEGRYPRLYDVDVIMHRAKK